MLDKYRRIHFSNLLRSALGGDSRPRKQKQRRYRERCKISKLAFVHSYSQSSFQDTSPLSGRSRRTWTNPSTACFSILA